MTGQTRGYTAELCVFLEQRNATLEAENERLSNKLNADSQDFEIQCLRAENDLLRAENERLRNALKASSKMLEATE